MNARTAPALALLLLPLIAHAEPKFGTKLGEVDFRDWQNGLVLKLANCKESQNIPIQEMKFTVEDRKVHVDRVKLILHTGEQLDIKLDKDIKSDMDQKWFSIGDKPGCISMIRIVEDEKAKIIPPPTRVVMTVWGR